MNHLDNKSNQKEDKKTKNNEDVKQKGQVQSNTVYRCFVCGEKVLDCSDEQVTVIKEYIEYDYAYVCYDCLNLPIKTYKNSITLAEHLHRLKMLRRQTF